MAEHLKVIAEICKAMNADGFAHTPRLVPAAEFDLSKFDEQKSGFPGVEFEYVNQSGPGMAGDDFTGTIAVPIGEWIFALDYAS